MSADLLREAAAKMRERAEAAPRPIPTHRYPNPWNNYFDRLRRTGNRHDRAAAEHAASWHPAVALAVADWLDEEAAAVEFDGGRPDLLSRGALAAARAYLGSDA